LYRILQGLAALLGIFVFGTIGYRLIEGWSFLDSLYMTAITISTVGYAEIHPLSTGGRIFSIILILAGVGTAFYILTSLVQYFLEGEFGIRLGRQRMEAKIAKLRNHLILCGYGRVGQEIARALRQDGIEFVVIEHDETNINKAYEKDCLVINGDATKNEILQQAGIDNAVGLITALGDDAANTYTTLAAHGLNPGLTIISRAGSSEATRRLLQAGAKHVVSPEAIGGQRMARLAVHPTTIQFIETVFSSQEEALMIEEIDISENSMFLGTTLQEIEDQFPRIKILAFQQEDGGLIINPSPRTVIEKGSTFTAFGPLEQLQSLEGCCVSLKTTSSKTSTRKKNK
jgi:voltage-gated potassium channel